MLSSPISCQCVSQCWEQSSCLRWVSHAMGARPAQRPACWYFPCCCSEFLPLWQPHQPSSPKLSYNLTTPRQCHGDTQVTLRPVTLAWPHQSLRVHINVISSDEGDIHRTLSNIIKRNRNLPNNLITFSFENQSQILIVKKIMIVGKSFR